MRMPNIDPKKNIIIKSTAHAETGLYARTQRMWVATTTISYILRVSRSRTYNLRARKSILIFIWTVLRQCKLYMRRSNWMNYLNVIPLDFVAEPVVGGECNGQQCNGHNGGDGGQRQRNGGARHLSEYVCEWVSEWVWVRSAEILGKLMVASAAGLILS